MKWALIGLLTLGALGAWAMSVQAAGGLTAEVKTSPLPKIAMRPLPPLQAGPAIAVPAPPPPSKPEAVAAKEEPKAEPKPEPVAAKPEPKPEPVAAKPEPKPEPVAAKPEPKPEPVKVATAKEPAPKAEPKPKPPPAEEAAAPPPAEKPKPAPALKPTPDEPKEEKAAAPPPAAGGEGSINLKASDTAEIVVDGRKVGPSPKLGYKLKSGKHKVRFDCYDENGNLKPGKVQTVEIRPDEETDLEYECPFTQ